MTEIPVRSSKNSNKIRAKKMLTDTMTSARAVLYTELEVVSVE